MPAMAPTIRALLVLFCVLYPATAQEPAAHLSRFAAGDGASHADGVYRLLARALRESGGIRGIPRISDTAM